MRKIIFVYLFFVLISGFVWAQRPEPAGFISSPTSTSTMGLFRSPVDNYINVSFFPQAQVENWFTYASFYEDFNVSLGYARRFNGIFLGLYYGGNLFLGFNDTQFSEQLFDNFTGTDKLIKVFTDTAPDPVSHILRSENYNDNRFAVLIGLNNMGFRFSFATNYDSFKGDDIAIGSITSVYSEYLKGDGWFVPQLQWGMTQPIFARGFQPSVTFELGFARFLNRYTEYTAGDWTTTGENTIYSENFVQPKLLLGMGEYTISETERFKFNADLGYNISWRAFNNNYSWTEDGLDYKTIAIKGFNSPPPADSPPDTPNSLTERRFNQHFITPSITAEYTSRVLQVCLTMTEPWKNTLMILQALLLLSSRA
jgi:hypothetical protein